MLIKVAIIGYGYMGVIRVVELHRELELSIICETDPEKLADEKSFTVVQDPKEVLESDTQAVFVCTPNHLIPDLTVQCLERGKHVFCEKPPGRTL